MSKTNHRDCGEKHDHRAHRYTSVFSKKGPIYIMNFFSVFSVVGFDKTEVSNG
jgi:hypothetical protein